jgi:Fur family ferric uptake transcriptional regulator
MPSSRSNTGPSRLDDEGLRKAGLKPTWPRLNVMKVLRGKRRRHLTAIEIYRSLREAGVELSMGNVYGAVSSLEGAGIIRRISVSPDQRAIFELADSPSHDHMICLDTGTIQEFRNEDLIQAAREIAEQHGYDVESHNLVLYVRKNGKRRSRGKS